LIADKPSKGLAIVNRHLSVSRGVIIALAASSIGMLAGGTLGNAAATYRWARKYGISAEGAGLEGMLPSIFNNATLMVLAIAEILHLLLAHKLSSVQFSI
jgi:glycosyltransferase 2 family protein